MVLSRNGKRHLIFCYKINTPTNFVHLQLQSLDMYFFNFFSRKTLPLKVNEKRQTIFYSNNKNTNQFNAFAIKNEFGNVSEIGESRFENSLSKTF